MNYALPVVTYNMPYVELLKGNTGAISCEPYNYIMMAQAIMAILTDEEYAKKLSMGSRKRILEESEIDIQKLWQDELDGLINNKDHRTHNEDMKIFLDTVYEHYNYPKQMVYSYKKSLLITNLFRYFKKFGVKTTIKKIRNYIRKYGFRAAIKRGKIRI